MHRRKNYTVPLGIGYPTSYASCSYFLSEKESNQRNLLKIVTLDSLSTPRAVGFGAGADCRAKKLVCVHRNLTPASESSLGTPPTILSALGSRSAFWTSVFLL